MSVIVGVLKEELENSLGMKKRYEQEISRLPKGSVCRKKVKNWEYDYLVFRRGGKVVLEYLGKLSPEKKSVYAVAKKKRAQYKNLLSDLNDQIHFLRRALHVRKKRSPRPRP